MGIRIRKGLPPFVPVSLGGGAHFRLRTATAAEVEAAAARIGMQVAALIAGGEEAERIAALIPDFDLGELPEIATASREETRDILDRLGIRSRLARLQDRLLLIELCAQCNDGWTGVQDEAGTEVSVPDRGWIVALLADPQISERCRGRIFAALHEEADEGNASAASRGGAQAAETNIAPVAGNAAPPVPSA